MKNTAIRTETAPDTRTDPQVPLGLYVHVPFCAVTCDFCAFYQKSPERGDFRRYLDGIRREFDLLRLSPDRPVSTVFWGGGTPGLLPPECIRELGGLIREKTAGEPVEWSVELTPEAARSARLEALRAVGVNRISLGVQSFRDRLLEAIGRRSSRRNILAAWTKLREHGFGNLNIDLMFAFPGQTAEDWEGDLREAVALAPEHLSTYCITFEEDTALWVKLSRGEVALDEEKEAAFFGAAEEILEASGLMKYEISNYARPGRECLHNLNTWRMNEWVGIGPAAASQYGGFRCANPADFGEWLAGLERGVRGSEDRVELTPEILSADSLLFGLRLREGVSPAAIRERFSAARPSVLDDYFAGLEADGLAERTDSERLRLTFRGRLLADRIGADILDRFD